MNIIVAITEVKELDERFELKESGVADEYVTRVLNEFDEYALEEAVQIKEGSETEDVDIVAVTIGPERTTDIVRTALAKGADRAIRVWDDVLEETTMLCPLQKARILAPVIREEDAGLVFTGVQSKDYAFGATGVALAEEIDYSWAAVVCGLDFDDSVASVRRELEGGLEELTEVELPAVLTIQSGINQPRYANFRQIRAAESKEVATKSLQDIELDPSSVESGGEIIDMNEPKPEGETIYLEGSPDDQASELVEALRERAGVL